MGVIIFHPATQVNSILENRWKIYFGRYQVSKRTYTMFVDVGYQRSAPIRPYINRERESRNEKRPWNSKLIRKLLLTVIVADLEWFTPKSKPVIYIGALVELYNWRNYRQIYKIYKMIELEKMHALITENPCNLGAYLIIEISLVLRSAHMVPRDQDKVVFYVNNYIDLDQFNQLYDPDWIEKSIQNVDAIVYKFRLALIRVTNHKLEVAKEK